MKIVTFNLVLLALATSGWAQDLFNPPQRLWKPQKDEVYLQEVSRKVFTPSAVTSVAAFEGECFALVENEIFSLNGEKLQKINAAPSQIEMLKEAGGKLWAVADEGLFMFDGLKWEKVDGRKMVDICMHQGAVHAATEDEIFRFEEGRFISLEPEDGYRTSNVTMVMEDGTQVHVDPVKLGPVEKIASYSGTLYLLRPGELICFDGQVVNSDFIDWGSIPSKNTRDMLSFGSRLFIAADRGLAVLRGASLYEIKGDDGLPVENTTCLEQGFDGDIWIGTQRGAVRMLDDEWHYFGADLWLPGNHVYDIATNGKNVFIATEKGLGIVDYEPYTLRKKADYYERHLEEWGHKRLGFIHTVYRKDGEWVREISDNDGGHTSPYLAAMCFKYAVTGDQEAREEAVESFKAMLWLEKIVPIDGFFARAIWSATGDKDERSRHGSGGLPAKWYPTPDGKWFWKGDTSSDEVIAMFYSVSIFHDLVAEGKEKEEARELLKRVANYIIDCGWVLKDMDGETTRWGRWNPEYLLRPYGYVDRGINGLEALTFMETAHALTGDEKFRKGNQQLLDWDYHTNTIRQKNVFPPENIATWDDNHAFRSYYTLLRYVKNPALRSVYLRSLERTWEVKRMEQIPWFNYVYGAITGNDCEAGKMVKHLREWVLDCTEYNYRNSHRDDLFVEPGYKSYEGGRKRISPREMSVTRSSRSAIALDGGRNGNRVMEPTGFLRDYWKGRYHGFIEAPETTDPALISVEKNRGKQFGAAPFAGPERPEVY
jgi:hypothetical protein